MNESGKDDGWEEFGENYFRNAEEAPIPKGREMTVEEEGQFLAWLFCDSIKKDIHRIEQGGRMEVQ